VLSGEETDTNSMVVDLIRTRLKPAICRIHSFVIKQQ